MKITERLLRLEMDVKFIKKLLYVILGAITASTGINLV